MSGFPLERVATGDAGLVIFDIWNAATRTWTVVSASRSGTAQRVAQQNRPVQVLGTTVVGILVD